ncbi:unnamed protein product, partial [Amoebophrya sp. A120]|eukprot:GSA120T00017117001.1
MKMKRLKNQNNILVGASPPRHWHDGKCHHRQKQRHGGKLLPLSSARDR